MVVGLDPFAKHFADYQDKYLLIGGAASWLVLDEAGMNPRATKDLDIVLCIEALDPGFAAVFWEFIRLGGYEIQERSNGAKVFYRFRKPAQTGYPVMLELFSRKPNRLVLGDDAHLTPIPVGEDVSSLSAILLDNEYYDFLHHHKVEISGVSLVSEACLIPLKARAWLDLTKRKQAGENIDSHDIKKHRADVLRLYQLIEPRSVIKLPEPVRADLAEFLDSVEQEVDAQLLKNLSFTGITPAEVIQAIRNAYAIAEPNE